MAGIRGCGRYLQQSHHAANGYCEEADGGKLLLEGGTCDGRGEVNQGGRILWGCEKGGVVGGRGRWYSTFQVGCPKIATKYHVQNRTSTNLLQNFNSKSPSKVCTCADSRTTNLKTAVWESAG